MKRSVAPLLPAIASLSVYLGTIAHRPLFIEDETRYAEIAREMVSSGNWVSPTLNGLDYFEKPVMGHWLNAAAQMVFGENGFSVRFFPAVAALATALLLLTWVRSRTGNAQLARSSAFIYLSSALVFATGTFGVLDSQLTFFTTAAMLSGFTALRADRLREKMLYLVVSGAAVGCAFLTKGFVALAIVGMPLFLHLLLTRDWKQMFLAPWPVLLTAAAAALPWSVAIHRQSPDFWNYFFWTEHVQRALGHASSQHPQPFWFFLWVFPVVLMPWTLFVPAAVKGLRGAWKNSPFVNELNFALCMILPAFVFFSLCSGKLMTYLLPLFPATAFLLAAGLESYTARCPSGKWIDRPATVAGLALMAALSGFAAYQAVGFMRLIPESRLLYSPAEKLPCLLAELGGAGLTCGLLAVVKMKEWNRKVLSVAIGAMAVMLVAHFAMPMRVIAPIAPELFYKQYLANITPNTKVVAYNKLIGSVCWMLKRSDVIIYANEGELTYGVEHSDRPGVLLTPEEFSAWVDSGEYEHIVVMMNSNRRRKRLPPSPFSVWKNKLLYQEYVK